MKENEVLARFLEVTKEMVGYECDEIKYFRKATNSPRKARFVFGAKYRRTFTPFYELHVLSNCKLEIPDQVTIVFDASPDRKTRPRVTELLNNQVVSQIIFDVDTYSLTIEFENRLILSLPNNDGGKESFELSSNFVPHPRGGRGLIFTVHGKQLLLGGWMS